MNSVKGIDKTELEKITLEINSLSKELQDIFTSINVITNNMRDNISGDIITELNNNYDVIAKNFKIAYKNTIFIEEYLKSVIVNYDAKQHELSDNLH